MRFGRITGSLAGLAYGLPTLALAYGLPTLHGLPTRITGAFGALQASLREVRPFEGDDFEDAYLLEAVRDCEGNHLSFPIPPIELLEHMLQHPEKR